MILDEIVAFKRQEIEKAKQNKSLLKLKRLALRSKGRNHLLMRVLSQEKKLHLICELKKASPSAGTLRKHFNPRVLTRNFEEAGASAISVLTEKRYFEGNVSILRQVRSQTKLPILRKDFIVDPYQVYETAILGANAILLIVLLIKKDEELKDMIQLADSLGLDVLVEAHTKKELERALKAGSKLFGLNNRNLETLKIDSSCAEKLIQYIPKKITIVVESGIETREDIIRYQSLGIRCFLIGTALMKAKNAQKKIRELNGEIV